MKKLLLIAMLSFLGNAETNSIKIIDYIGTYKNGPYGSIVIKEKDVGNFNMEFNYKYGNEDPSCKILVDFDTKNLKNNETVFIDDSKKRTLTIDFSSKDKLEVKFVNNGAHKDYCSLVQQVYLKGEYLKI